MFNEKHALETLAEGIIYITENYQDDPFADGPQVGTGKFQGITLKNALEAQLLLAKEMSKLKASELSTKARAKIVAGYDQYERDSWPIKKAEAEKVIQDENYISSMLLAELAAREIEGETARDLAKTILINAETLSTAVSTIKGLETNINNAIDSAENTTEIITAIAAFNQKINSILTQLS